MQLTVIVCTIPDRRQLLSRCLWHLQHQTVQDFDVIIAQGRKAGKGSKVNMAKNMANTSHVMVCDDDDWLALHTVEALLPYAEDYVGFDAVQMVQGRYANTFHQETASHICPLKTEIARLLPMDDDYLGDIRWTKATAPYVKTETYVDQPLYFYDKWVDRSGWSPPRQVGWWPYDKLHHNFRWV